MQHGRQIIRTNNPAFRENLFRTRLQSRPRHAAREIVRSRSRNHKPFRLDLVVLDDFRVKVHRVPYCSTDLAGLELVGVLTDLLYEFGNRAHEVIFSEDFVVAIAHHDEDGRALMAQ